MPAILTHHFYGRDMYFTAANELGTRSPEERKAYLLGCQGPDPFSFLVVDPRLKQWAPLCERMHQEKVEELLAALKDSLEYLSDHERPTGRAYAAGFIAHFELDSRVHPFVDWWVQQLCAAGVEGLDDRDEQVVHAEVERDLDEMVLFTKTGQTVETFKPYHECLEATDRILGIVSRMWRYAILKVYGEVTPQGLFTGAVNASRTALRLLWAPNLTDVQSKVASSVEVNVLHHRHSYYRALSHRARKETTSSFENAGHEDWRNPYTGEVRNASFWDLFYTTQGEVQCDLKCFLAKDFDAQQALRITHGVDFEGRPEK